MSSIPDAEAFNWVVGPVGRCIAYVADETRIAGVLHRAIGVLAGMEPMLIVLRRSFVQSSVPTDGIDQLLAHQRTLGPWAKDILDAQLHPINSHALIGLWSAVEVAVEDTLRLVLIKDSLSLAIVFEAGTKMRDKPTSPLSEEDAQRVARAFERHARSSRPVGHAYAYMLSALGIEVKLPDSVATTVSEINYVRNILLHRGGIVDSRVAAEAPELGLQPGSKIAVTSKTYERYYDAVGEFAKAFLDGVVKSRHIRVKGEGGL